MRRVGLSLHIHFFEVIMKFPLFADLEHATQQYLLESA